MITMMSIGDKNSRIALFASLAFHVLVFFILAWIHIGSDFTIPELIEISFVSGTDASLTPAIPADARPVAKAIENESEKLAEVVQLPERTMQEIEAPSLKVIDRSKQIPTEEIMPIPTDEKNKEREKREEREIVPDLGEKEVAVHQEDRTLDQKIIPGQAQTTAIVGEFPYQIEGQAAKRAVIYRVIPEYPANLQKEAIIKISFTVLPNGQVGDMIPVIKSDATLERITLDALRQWRFNPLPAYESQQTEKGIITFRYLLK